MARAATKIQARFRGHTLRGQRWHRQQMEFRKPPPPPMPVTHYSVNHFAEQLNSLPFAPRSAWQPTAEPVRVPIRSRFELIERGERLLHEPDLPIESDAEEPPPHAAYKSFTPRNLRSCPPGRGQQTPVAVALAKAPRAASRKPPPPPPQQEPSPRWPPRRWPASPSQPLTFVPVPRAKPTAGRDRHQAPAPRQLVTVPSVPLYRLPPPPPPPSSTRVPQPSDDLRPATARGRSGLLKPQSGRPWSAPSRSAPPSRSLAASSCCSGQDWTETVESERGDGFPTSPSKAKPAAAAEESYLSMLRAKRTASTEQRDRMLGKPWGTQLMAGEASGKVAGAGWSQMHRGAPKPPRRNLVDPVRMIRVADLM